MDIELLNSDASGRMGSALGFPDGSSGRLAGSRQPGAGRSGAALDLCGIPRTDDVARRVAPRSGRICRWMSVCRPAWSSAAVPSTALCFTCWRIWRRCRTTEARYRQLGVSMDIFDDTMKDFLNYLGDFYDLHGYWGYAQFAWIWRHLTCELFRLGRLQYMLAPFHSGVTAFRRKLSKEGTLAKSSTDWRPDLSGLDGGPMVTCRTWISSCWLIPTGPCVPTAMLMALDSTPVR